RRAGDAAPGAPDGVRRALPRLATSGNWRADFVKEIPDEAVARHMEFAERLPTWKSTMHLYPIDGAAIESARATPPGRIATPFGPRSWSASTRTRRARSCSGPGRSTT